MDADHRYRTGADPDDRVNTVHPGSGVVATGPWGRWLRLALSARSALSRRLLRSNPWRQSRPNCRLSQ